MRRNEKEVKSREEIDSYIAKATICRVGLVDDGEAYIVPMDFGCEDGCFYFHCAKEGRKIDIIRRSPKASFELEIDHGLKMDKDAYKCTHHFVCVMGTGTITIVEDETERMKGLKALMGQYSKDMYDMTEKCKVKVHVLRLKVDTISCKKNGL
jgi:uncharacterized protein